MGVRHIYNVNILEQTEQELGDTHILFVLPDGGEIEVMHASRQDLEGTISIRAKNGSLSVLPRISNQVCVKVERVENVRPEYRNKRKK